jgi:hypothetical protein
MMSTLFSNGDHPHSQSGKSFAITGDRDVPNMEFNGVSRSKCILSAKEQAGICDAAPAALLYPAAQSPGTVFAKQTSQGETQALQIRFTHWSMFILIMLNHLQHR